MRVNEIFYSLQGEGHFTGTAATFIRLSGCNLRCAFCDTRHTAFSEMTEQQIADIAALNASRHVVITGGEPLLQLTAALTTLLHKAGKFIQIETNGCFPIADGCEIDWVTCSPKFEFIANADVRIQHIDELKVVWNGENDMTLYDGIKAQVRSLQPCDTGDERRNGDIAATATEYCKSHPEWRLSLQTHKMLNIR